MPNKIIVVIAENISLPFDEGMKNVLYNLTTNLQARAKCIVITKAGNKTEGLSVKKIRLNKWFLNVSIRKIIKKIAPDIILYVPEASLTFNSLIRAKILKYIYKKARVVVLGLQPRKYSILQKKLLPIIRPDLLCLIGEANKNIFEKNNFNLAILPPAVDQNKFKASNNLDKNELRKKYNLPENKIIVTHVGHIKFNRNIVCLISLQKNKNIQVLVVGSTSTHADKKIISMLKENGIIVLQSYIPHIQEIYQLSDIYVFPVFDSMAAIETPLSVFEAIACGLPVVMTRFNGMESYFSEDAGIKYFDTNAQLFEIVKSMSLQGIQQFDNINKVKLYSWQRFTDKLISEFDCLP